MNSSLLQKILLTLFVGGFSPPGSMSPGLYTPITRVGWLLMPMHMKWRTCSRLSSMNMSMPALLA
jgi:hypothetical protein